MLKDLKAREFDSLKPPKVSREFDSLKPPKVSQTLM